MNYKSIILFVVGLVVLTLAPWAILAGMNHGLLHVPPEIVDDSVYYYARMHDVSIGLPFIGNPYFKEHAHDIATAFFGADWVSAIPLFFGVGLFPTILLNAVFWMLVFVWLAYVLGRTLDLSKRSSIILAAISLLPSFWLIERPVAMQIVFPAFLFFLISYLSWLKDPKSRKWGILLVISSALSFYLYTYFWQIVAVVIAFTHLLFLSKDRRAYLSLLAIDVAVGILALPIVWYTYLQITHANYWETVTRIGLVETHTFGGAAVLSLGIVAIVYGVFHLKVRPSVPKHISFFFGCTAAALLVANFSNVISGKDLEIAVHISRFIYLWAAVVGAYILIRLFPKWRQNKIPCAIVATVLIWFAAGVVPTFATVSPALLSAQAYAAPTEWLNSHAASGSVVFADDSLSYYIPVETKDYVLFQPDGGLHLMPDSEVATRYLTSRIFNNLTLEDIERDVRLYAGVGNAVHAYKIENRRILLCKVTLQKNCGTPATAVSYKGVSYFEDLENHYANITSNPRASLKEFDVNYILKDTLNDVTWHPETIPGARLVATVGRFEIYAFE